MPSEVWMKSLTNLHRWHLWMDKQSGDGVGVGSGEWGGVGGGVGGWLVGCVYGCGMSGCGGVGGGWGGGGGVVVVARGAEHGFTG